MGNLSKIIIFFINTNALEHSLSWAHDLMDLDSKDGCETLIQKIQDNLDYDNQYFAIYPSINAVHRVHHVSENDSNKLVDFVEYGNSILFIHFRP